MPSLKRVAPPLQRRAWTIRDWCAETSISRASCYRLMNAGVIRFVMIGRARRIVTPPSDFIRALEAEQSVA
jgi:predicted DNA-binding transcriptional regulator AlpA